MVSPSNGSAVHMTQAAKGRTTMSPRSIVDEILAAISQLSVPASTNAPAAQSPQPSSTQNDSPVLSLAPDALQAAKSLIVSLHVIFPHELLPALDLLDRGLVNRVVLSLAKTTSSDNHQGALGSRIETSNNEDTKISSPQNAATTSKAVLRQGLNPTSPSTSIPRSSLYYVQSASAASHIPPSANTNHSSLNTNPIPSDSGTTWNTRRRGTQTYYEIRLDSWNCTCAAFAFSVLKSLVVGDDTGPEPFEFRDIGGPHDGGAQRGGENGDGDDVGNAGFSNARSLDGHHDEEDEGHNTLEQSLDETDQNSQTKHTLRELPNITTTYTFGGTLTLPLTRTKPSSGSSTHPASASIRTTIPAPIPVCKHILAALLADAAPNVFVEGIQVRLLRLDREEVAAWAGGWGGG
jgi:hypothetical protein